MDEFLAWFAEHWAILLTGLIGLVAALGWLRERMGRPRYLAAPDESSASFAQRVSRRPPPSLGNAASAPSDGAKPQAGARVARAARGAAVAPSARAAPHGQPGRLLHPGPVSGASGADAGEPSFGLDAAPVSAEPIAGEVFVTVHYATTRRPTGRKQPNDYYGPERGELAYGRVKVSIPEHHVVGNLERPRFFFLEFSEDPKTHVVLRSLGTLEEDAFFSGLRDDVESTDQRVAFVFIHGFKVTFAEAARRAAQMAYDLFLTGASRGEAILSTVPILFSWASEGTATLYPHDINNAGASADHLKQFLRDVAAKSGAESIVVVAHSMGNQPLISALEKIGLEMRDGDGPIIKEIILAAPDIDQQIFRNAAHAVKRTASRVTIYASGRDRALKLSIEYNGYPRLGQTEGGIVIVDGIDSIDASIAGEDILAHSAYGQTNLLMDMHYLIVTGTPPDKRFGLLSQGEPPARYWKMRERAPG